MLVQKDALKKNYFNLNAITAIKTLLEDQAMMVVELTCHGSQWVQNGRD